MEACSQPLSPPWNTHNPKLEVLGFSPSSAPHSSFLLVQVTPAVLLAAGPGLVQPSCYRDLGNETDFLFKQAHSFK